MVRRLYKLSLEGKIFLSVTIKLRKNESYCISMEVIFNINMNGEKCPAEIRNGKFVVKSHPKIVQMQINIKKIKSFNRIRSLPDFSRFLKPLILSRRFS